MLSGEDNGWQAWCQGLWEEGAGEVQEKHGQELDWDSVWKMNGEMEVWRWKGKGKLQQLTTERQWPVENNSEASCFWSQCYAVIAHCSWQVSPFSWVGTALQFQQRCLTTPTPITVKQHVRLTPTGDMERCLVPGVSGARRAQNSWLGCQSRCRRPAPCSPPGYSASPGCQRDA